jgi:ribosomal-protein-alanine N-acetyltransferase
MTQKDVQTITQLEEEIFPDPWTLKSFQTEIENNKFSYPCLIEEKGNILGYAVVWYYSGEIHIGNFAVKHTSRKKGLGKLLLEHILHKFSNYEMAFLEVRKSNLPAINLYKKFGFEELYIREFYYTNGEDAIVMGRKLKQ